MKIGTLALRATIGTYFVGHGAQKLFGVLGGHGLKGTAQYFESIGLKPGIAQATAAGVAETAGGAGLVLGYHTPLAASAIVATMTTAIQKVHGKNGWNIQDGGFEYNTVLIAGAVAIAESGPGFLSLDALRGKQRKGVVPGALALVVGVGGALGAQAAAGYFGGSSPLEAGAAEPAPDGTPETLGEPPATVEPAPLSQPGTVEEALAEAPDEPLAVETLTAEPVAEIPTVEPVAEDAPAEGES